MSTTSTETTTELALAFQPAGYDEIPATTILTRLNYYDGKFLRADDLRLEQDYHRRLAELGARAGGSGVVYGFDVSLGSGDELTVGGGLGFDPAGRVLYLPAPFSIGLQAVADATSRMLMRASALGDGAGAFTICAADTPAQPPTSVGPEFYLLTIAHAEDACGDEDVFGKLCDDGCATSTDRARVLEGIVLRARAYQPSTAFASSKVVQLTERHIRSQLASAAFADERLVVPSRISKAGLLSGAWCNGAAAPTGWEVPIAVVGKLTASTFVDEWIVRRERMETPPRRYWAWTMAMRPWDAFLAQILQFQCQLPSALGGQNGAGVTDPCAQQRDVLGDAARYIGQLQIALAPPAGGADAPVHVLSTEPGSFLTEIGGLARLQNLQLKLSDVLQQVTAPSQRILVDGGIVELPPAGYLPVTPGTTPPVDVQVRRLLGDGVDLRFCVTTPDYIPHALEKGQHMERISLLQGLDDPNAKPPVDILVPDGTLGAAAVQAHGWDAQLAFSAAVLGGTFAETSLTHLVTPPAVVVHGVARSAPVAGGGGELVFAGPGSLQPVAGGAGSGSLAAYASARFDVDPFALGVGGVFSLSAEGALANPASKPALGVRGSVTASLTVEQPAQETSAGTVLTAAGSLQGSRTETGADVPPSSGAMQVSLRITRSGQTYEVAVTSDAAGSPGEVLLWATWQGTPTTVLAAGEIQAVAGVEPAGAAATAATLIGVATPLANPRAAAKLVGSTDIFSPSNQLNVQAHGALQTLSDAFSDAQYTGTVATRLFSPTVDGGGATGITATRDWVLFVRRRHKDCQVAQAPPPATKTYGVYVIEADNAEAYKLALSAVMHDDAIELKRVGVRGAGDAAFSAGTATLTSAAASVVAAWSATNPGGLIAAAVVATDETDETTAMLQQRVYAYQTAVASVSKPETNEQLFNRASLASLPDAGVDGQIVFITQPQPIRYHVYATGNSDATASLARLVEGGISIDKYFSVFAATMLIDLGTLTFADTTATVETNALKTLADVGLQNGMERFVVISQSGAPTEPESDQASAIMSEIGATAPLPNVETVAAAAGIAWPSDSPFVVLLAAPGLIT